MRDPDRRRIWLARAEDAAGASRNARLATEAELALDERRFEEAREILSELHATGPRHVATLRLLMRAEQGLQNWDEVLRLLRILEKRGAMAPEPAAQLRITATVENLRKKALDAESLAAFWDKVPAADRVQPRIAVRGGASLHVARRLPRRRTRSSATRSRQSGRSSSSRSTASAARGRRARAHRAVRAVARGASARRGAARSRSDGCAPSASCGARRRAISTRACRAQPSRAAHVELARLLERIGRDARREPALPRCGRSEAAGIAAMTVRPEVQPEDLEIVDAHHHLWDLGRNYYPWLADHPEPNFLLGDYAPLKRNYLPEDYRRDAAGLKVIATVHVEAEHDRNRQVAETEWLHEIGARHGLPNAVVAHAWFHTDDCEEILVRQKRLPARPRHPLEARDGPLGGRNSADRRGQHA